MVHGEYILSEVSMFFVWVAFTSFIKKILDYYRDDLEFHMNDVEFQEMMTVINRISKKDTPATLVDVCRLLEMQGILLVRILKTLDDIHESK